MYKYCWSDVDILRRGCTKLRELFIEIASMDPFQNVTIAVVCQAFSSNVHYAPKPFLPNDARLDGVSF